MKNNYVDELRNMAGYDENGNEIDDVTVADENTEIANDGQEPPFDTTGGIECVVKLKEKDMRQFMFHHAYSSFSGWFGVLISIAAVVMLIIGRNQYDTMQKVVLLVFALLFTVIQPVKIWFRAKMQISKLDMFQDVLEYNLCKEGILVKQGELYVNIRWDSISRINKTKHAVYIYTSPVRAFIFPLDQIQNIEEFSEKLKNNVKVRRGM